MSEPLFDFSHEYDQMLNEGLKLSGEDKEYFVAGRLMELKKRLPAGFSPSRILDFGCGTGGTSTALKLMFPDAEIVGVDASQAALAAARRLNAGEGLSFHDLADLKPDASFDLCYVNGVFHHIEPERRAEALALILGSLKAGGYLALFENNPWNPGTRLVMSRIPFDRDAKTFSIPQARRMLAAAGFDIASEGNFFYFPRMLSFLRFSEPALSFFLPLGAQYLVLGLKKSSA
jgi:SAM-dependent methyltransferase